MKKITDREYEQKHLKRTSLYKKKKRSGVLVSGRFVKESNSGATELGAHNSGAWGSFLVTKRHQ
jgi:hypothetical protein